MTQTKTIDATVLKNFNQERTQVRRTWKVAIAMSVLLYGLFVYMAIMAVVMSYTTGKETYGVIFGGVSVAQFLGTLIWRPYDNVLKAMLAMASMDVMLVTLEMQCETCDAITDPKDRCEQIKAAGEAALSAVSALIDKLVPK